MWKDVEDAILDSVKEYEKEVENKATELIEVHKKYDGIFDNKIKKTWKKIKKGYDKGYLEKLIHILEEENKSNEIQQIQLLIDNFDDENLEMSNLSQVATIIKRYKNKLPCEQTMTDRLFRALGGEDCE